MDERPVPYNEEDDTSPFWLPDPFDKYLPEKGFITDFVYSLRGTEVPTAFAIWASLYLISTVIKRESYIKWMDDKLYTNYYTILVGTAGVVKKGTVISRVDKIIRKFPSFIGDRNIRYIKTPHILRNKATPEAILEAMLVDKRGGVVYTWKDDQGKTILVDDKPVVYKKTSELGMLLPELAVLAGRQKYNTGTIENLLDLYDCHDEWEFRTISRGFQVLKYLHTTLLGAATESSIQESIPKVAVGDGFLSRTVVMRQKTTARRFSMPRIVEGAPDINELSRRIAWMAETYWGPFEISDKAFRVYDGWYMRFKDELDHSQSPGLKSRLDTIVLKVSMLLAIQRYTKDLEISQQDMKSSIALVEATYQMSSGLMDDINGDDNWRRSQRVLAYIKTKKAVKRSMLIKNQHIFADNAKIIIDQLYQEGAINIYRNGNKQSCSSKDSNELYKYNSDYDNEDDTEDA